MQMDWVPAAIVELNQYPEQHFAPSVFRDCRGQVVATCGRTEEGVLISRSADGGLNWTRPQALEVPGRTEGLLGSTRSGRLLWIICESTEAENHAAGQVTSELIGEAPRGRGIWRHSGYCVARVALKTWYSDDEGRTWQGGGRADISPLLTGYPFHRPVELADGTLLLNVYGYFAPEEMDRIAISSCVLRSTDHGATWGALQAVGRGSLAAGVRYSETGLAELEDGRLAALLRTEAPDRHGKVGGAMSIAYSRDGGKTWSRPLPSILGSRPHALALPDGGLLGIADSQHTSYVALSKDGGASWITQHQIWAVHYRNPLACGYPEGVVLDEETALVVLNGPREHTGGKRVIWACQVRRTERDAAFPYGP